MTATKRVLALCSGGGHWAEMRRIMPAFAGLDVSYASVRAEYAAETNGRPFYTFTDFTRFNLGRSLWTSAQMAAILIRVRPHIVITTGAAPALLAFAMARFFGARTIWIDSVANADRLSTSGRLAKPLADVWLTQWQHLARDGGPNHWGAIL